MVPADYNLQIYRGDTSRWRFVLWADCAKTVPVDLTNCQATALICDKTTGGAYGIRLATTITLPNVIDMLLTSTQSRGLPPSGVWDLQLTYTSQDVLTMLKGSVTITQDVIPTTPPVLEVA